MYRQGKSEEDVKSTTAFMSLIAQAGGIDAFLQNTNQESKIEESNESNDLEPELVDLEPESIELNEFEKIRLTQDYAYVPRGLNIDSTMRSFHQESFNQISGNVKTRLDKIAWLIKKLTNPYFDKDSNKFVKLHSKQLEKQVRDYKQVVDCLVKSGIVEVNDSYTVGDKPKSYRLTEKYISDNYIKREYATDKFKLKQEKENVDTLYEALQNPIASAQLQMYNKIILPSVEEVEEKAKQLHSAKTVIKGKRAILLHKSQAKGSARFKDIKEPIRWLNDDIERWERITEDNKLLIPVISGEQAGNRVYDGLNMAPVWIRNMIKDLEHNVLTGVDYKALHPNLIMQHFNNLHNLNEFTHITHERVADYLGLTKAEVKTEHLSFFNKPIWSMQKSPLYKFYVDNYPKTIAAVIFDKQTSEFKYKSTSRLAFGIEVTIMTKVIRKLAVEDIGALYVFDELMVSPKDVEFTKQTMIKTAKEFGFDLGV